MSAFYTEEEVAERWRRSPRTIKRMIEARLLDGVVRIGRGYLIPPEAVESYEKRNLVPGRKARG